MAEPQDAPGRSRAPMQSLEKALAFNRGYRAAWRDYFDQAGPHGIQTSLAALVSGLDDESATLCRRQVQLAPYFFPDPLLDCLYVNASAKRALLPPQSSQWLCDAGFFDKKQQRLDEIRTQLQLPIDPLPELLVHSGLSYIHDIAKTLIRGRTVIDGGAYIGDTASLAVRVYGAAQVHALEPIPDTYNQLTALVAQWGLADTIIPHMLALSDLPGTIELWGEGVGASTVPKQGPNLVSVPRTVNTCSIDSLVTDLGIQDVGLIKLDVEGTELRTIQGATTTITRDRPLLLISIYHTAQDFFEIKPLIARLSLNYRFMVRKLTDDLFKELVLICIPDHKT